MGVAPNPQRPWTGPAKRGGLGSERVGSLLFLVVAEFKNGGIAEENYKSKFVNVASVCASSP